MKEEKKSEEEGLGFLTCINLECGSKRLELLYYKEGFLWFRCLVCGDMLNLAFDKEIPLEEIKFETMKGSYLG